MEGKIQIEWSSGNVVVSDLKVTSATKPHDLTPLFQIGAEMPVRDGRETVPCMFATATVTEGARTVRVELRFERGVLVSIFFKLLDPDDRYTDSRSYYEGQSERYSEHLRWLQQKLGAEQGPHTRYPWGWVGVANGKGGEVHIFIHNQNNSLVCGRA